MIRRRNRDEKMGEHRMLRVDAAPALLNTVSCYDTMRFTFSPIGLSEIKAVDLSLNNFPDTSSRYRKSRPSVGRMGAPYQVKKVASCWKKKVRVKVDLQLAGILTKVDCSVFRKKDKLRFCKTWI